MKYAMVLAVGCVLAVTSLCRGDADEVQFPFAVPVERGVTSFTAGDQITISQVRGTAPDLLPGNTYEVKGTYRLLSHPEGELTAAVVAPNGSSAMVNPRQTIHATQGDNDFAVILPITQTGAPQLTLGVGGSSFGTMSLTTRKLPFIIEHRLTHSQLNPQDSLSVAEIRSSSKSMLPGNVLQVTGTWSLYSNGAARLMARLVHPGSAPDQSSPIPIAQGGGQFTLLVPVSGPSVLELIMLPNGSGGEPLGQIQLQLGNSRAGPSTLPSFVPTSPGGPRIISFNSSGWGWQTTLGKNGPNVSINFIMGGEMTDNVPRKFPYSLKFQTGMAMFPEGDSIQISKVEGTRPKIQVGGWYRISGHFDFHSARWAYFAAYVCAAGDPSDSTKAPREQEVQVFPSSGAYTLILPVRVRGWPHIALYPLGKGEDAVETRYFGTGDTVLRDWKQPYPAD